MAAVRFLPRPGPSPVPPWPHRGSIAPREAPNPPHLTPQAGATTIPRRAAKRHSTHEVMRRLPMPQRDGAHLD